MTDELKDQRIPIMMTPSEVKAIDDWMWERRIRSRGEAIRRLCQLGMLTEKQVGRRLQKVWQWQKERQGLTAGELRAGRAEFENAMIADVALSALEVHPFRSGKSIEEALTGATQLKAEIEGADFMTEAGYNKIINLLNSISQKKPD